MAGWRRESVPATRCLIRTVRNAAGTMREYVLSTTLHNVQLLSEFDARDAMETVLARLLGAKHLDAVQWRKHVSSLINDLLTLTSTGPIFQ